MDKGRLKQYGALKKELQMLDDKLDKLYERQENVPEVMGKVTGSSKDFPYTQVRTTVRMAEPKENDAIKKLIRIKEQRREQVNDLIVEIEEFIAGIPDSETRQIFEKIYIDGQTQYEVGVQLRLDRSRVSRKISEYLKNAHKAHK